MIIKKMISYIPFSPKRQGKKYYNFCPDGRRESPEWLFPSIKMYWQGRRHRKHEVVEHAAWVDAGYSMQDSLTEKGTLISWMGHASVLIRIGEKIILTDPIFGAPSFLYKRILPFGCPLESLPKIDIILISHNHRDHLDLNSVKLLHKRDNPLFLVPEGDKAWFLNQGIQNVEECTWWEQIVIPSADMNITFVPAWHWSQRGIFDHNCSLWGGWVIENAGETIYFAGDTAYQQQYFKAIGKLFPSIDVVLMPIGPGEPQALMHRSHVNAEEAGQAFLDCNARYFIPIHWGTFYFGIDLFEDPIKRLNIWWEKHQSIVPQNSLYVLKVGQLFHLQKILLHKNSC